MTSHSAHSARDYYEGFAEREWERLTTAEGAVEFAVNCHAIAAHLPCGARVLDIGGGPGRYSLWLAQRGHRVVLADLSPKLLEIARERLGASPHAFLVEDIVEADARDLSQWTSTSFDAVLSMGPFYHLPESVDRQQAAQELRRVLRPGGLAFVALMTRYALLRRTIAIPEERAHLAQPEFMAGLIDDGIFINDRPGRFTCGYGAHPEEVAPFFQSHGFQTLGLLSSESIGVGIEEAFAELAVSDPETYQTTLRTIIRAASDPSILGMANHLLYVGARA